ncbi:MAG TPA: YciI family protein [Opitutaceae bacterium]|nr:YciI family protein [Opitutaceae bacterium]
MKYFFLKLHGPRATFMQDMSPAEVDLMQRHGAYWRELMQRGFVAAFGPVADPAGGYGIGVLELPDDLDPWSLVREDPVAKAGAGFRFEILPMPRAIVRPVEKIATRSSLSPDEQMERFAQELKETDWGHQPC